MRHSALRQLTQDFLQLHDARVGTDVMDARGLLDLTGLIFIVEDIGKGQWLLRHHSHFGKDSAEALANVTAARAQLGTRTGLSKRG